MNQADFRQCYCVGCEELCDYGIVETSKFIRCVDKDITEYKGGEKDEIGRIIGKN